MIGSHVSGELCSTNQFDRVNVNEKVQAHRETDTGLEQMSSPTHIPLLNNVITSFLSFPSTDVTSETGNEKETGCFLPK